MASVTLFINFSSILMCAVHYTLLVIPADHFLLFIGKQTGLNAYILVSQLFSTHSCLQTVGCLRYRFLVCQQHAEQSLIETVRGMGLSIAVSYFHDKFHQPTLQSVLRHGNDIGKQWRLVSDSSLIFSRLWETHCTQTETAQSICFCVCLGIPSCLFFLSFSSHLGEDHLLEESSLECSFVTNSSICCDAATNTRSSASSLHSHGSGSHGCPRPSKNSGGTQFLEDNLSR